MVVCVRVCVCVCVCVCVWESTLVHLVHLSAPEFEHSYVHMFVWPPCVCVPLCEFILFSNMCVCVCVCETVCVQIADPSRGELLWMLFCSNYCYLFPLKQANCSIASCSACAGVGVCVNLLASLFIVCLCRIADPSNFFSMDTFSLWRQNSFCCSCWAAIWLFSQFSLSLSLSLSF